MIKLSGGPTFLYSPQSIFPQERRAPKCARGKCQNGISTRQNLGHFPRSSPVLDVRDRKKNLEEEERDRKGVKAVADSYRA